MLEPKWLRRYGTKSAMEGAIRWRLLVVVHAENRVPRIRGQLLHFLKITCEGAITSTHDGGLGASSPRQKLYVNLRWCFQSTSKRSRQCSDRSARAPWFACAVAHCAALSSSLRVVRSGISLLPQGRRFGSRQIPSFWIVAQRLNHSLGMTAMGCLSVSLRIISSSLPQSFCSLSCLVDMALQEDASTCGATCF